jgi:hypothetical protein
VSTEPQTARTAAQHIAQQDWKAIGAALGEALDGLGKDMRLLAQQQKQAREVAALYALHRQYRFRPAGAPPREETLALINAALDGYDPEYLEQLAMFGGFLADAAGKRYAAR